MSQNFKKFPLCLKFILLLMLPSLYADYSYAQGNVTVSGKVTDPETKNPLSNVSVLLKGTSTGVVTGDAGNYTISVPQGSTLVFTYLAYPSVEVKVSKAGTLDVSLSLVARSMDEVIVIGYGNRQKKDLTGAYGAVGEREISKSTSAAPEMALQGRLAGVQVSSPGGNPNTRTSVRIRGVTTLTNSGDGNNEPLYVIDGMPITEGGAGNPDLVVRDVRTPNNPMALINPNDIESITVLKDASAAAIYGVRAANGVILITTKRGKGKPRIEINALYGVQNAVSKGKELLNTQQFVSLYNEAYANNPSRSGNVVTPIGEVFGPEWDPASPKYLGNKPTYDWQKPFYNEDAPIKNINLKLLGATENLNYYVSGDINTVEGTLRGSKQDRYTLAANIVSKVSKVVEMGVNIRGIYAKSQNGLESTDLGLGVSPWQPVYGNGPNGYAPNTFVDSFVFNNKVLANNEPAWNPKLETTEAPYISWVNGVARAPAQLYGLQSKGNPFIVLDRNLGYNDYNNYRAIGNVYLQISPFKGLRLKGTLYGDYYNDKNISLATWDTWVFGATPSNPYESNIRKYDTTGVGNIGTRDRVNKSYTTEFLATYSTTLAKDHSIEVTAVANKQSWDWGLASNSGVIYTLNPNRYNISNASNLLNGGGYRKSWEGVRTLIGYVGRVSYKYADKYYLDATLRRDGSSRFAPGHRWGTFPAVAAAWRITGEKFMQNMNRPWLNDLKIRANWGKLGKETTYGWKYLSIVNPGITMPNYAFGSGNGNPIGSQQTGAYLPDFANTDLTWEEVTTSGVGVDASLFKNRLNLTIEYFSRLTTGMIQQVPAPYSSGIQNAIDLNVGEMKNSGMEFTAGYNMNAGPVNLGFNGNLTLLKNKVTKLYKGINLGDTYEDYSFGYIRGYKVGGIFQTQAEIDAWRAKYRDVTAGQSATDPAAGAYSPGDMWFQDLGASSTTPGKLNSNKDSIINDNDRVYLGKVIPGVVYGFGVNASYSNFELSVFLRGEADVQRVNNVKWGGESMSSNGSGQLATVLNRWTPANHSTTMPRAVYGDPRQNARFSDRWVEDAGYMRMQNLQLAYRVPVKILSKTNFIQGIRIYVMATNLFTITNYTGIDPENDYNPPAKQMIVGLSTSF